MRIRLSLNELLSLSRYCTKIKLNNTVFATVSLLLSHGTCIRSGVNGNAAIDGRGERNRERLRSTALDHPSKFSINQVA